MEDFVSRSKAHLRVAIFLDPHCVAWVYYLLVILHRFPEFPSVVVRRHSATSSGPFGDAAPTHAITTTATEDDRTAELDTDDKQSSVQERHVADIIEARNLLDSFV